MCMTEPLFVILSFPAHLPSGAETFFETNCQAVVCAGSIQRVHPKPALYFFFFFFFSEALEWICGLAVVSTLARDMLETTYHRLSSERRQSEPRCMM